MTDANFLTLETETCEIIASHIGDGRVGLFIDPKWIGAAGVGMAMTREDAIDFANGILDELEACDAAEPEPNYYTTLRPDGSFVVAALGRTYVLDGGTLAAIVDDVLDDDSDDCADDCVDCAAEVAAFEAALAAELSDRLDLNDRERVHFRSMLSAALDRVTSGEALN